MITIRMRDRQKRACRLFASPLAQPLAHGLLMVPTLINSDPYNRFIRIANLSAEDVLLPARTPVVRHGQITFLVLILTGPAANENDCKNSSQSMLLASPRTEKTWGLQKPSTTDFAPQTPFRWPSHTDAYLHTN